MLVIILVVVLVVVLWIFLKLYFEKFDNAFGYVGGLGSGKTLRGVKISLKLLRRNRFKVKWSNFKTRIYNLFHKKFKKALNKDIPLLYSSIPVLFQKL